jgi:hypothetical protein
MRYNLQGEIYSALELYADILQAFYHAAYLHNTKAFLNDLNSDEVYHIICFRPLKSRFDEFYTHVSSQGRCLYVTPYAMHLSTLEVASIIALRFRYDFSTFRDWSNGLEYGLRLYGRFLQPDIYEVPSSMVIDAATQSTIQAYAILGLRLLQIIYRHCSKEEARETLYCHQERVTNALPDWEYNLSEAQLSNLQLILSYDQEVFESTPGGSSTTPADHYTSPATAGSPSTPTGTSTKGSSKGSSKGTSKSKDTSIDEGDESNE